MRGNISPEKILQYLLVPSARDNKGKAIFFFARGFTPQEWEIFRNALLGHLAANPIMRDIRHKYGRKIVVECSIVTPDGRNPCIRSVWNDRGDGQFHLVTAYPNPD